MNTKKKYVDMWDSFKRLSEGFGWKTTTTDLISRTGPLRISGLFWQLKINRAVNERPQRGGHVSSLSPGSPMWSGSSYNGFSRHPSKWIWSRGEQRGKLESLPLSCSPGLTRLISVNNGTTGEGRQRGLEGLHTFQLKATAKRRLNHFSSASNIKKLIIH